MVDTPRSTATDLLSQPTLSVAELGTVLGIGRNSAYTLVRDNRIRHLRVGSRIRVSSAAVRELLG